MDRYLGKGPQLHAGGEIDHRDGRDTHRYGASPIGYAAREIGESGQCEALVAEGRAATGAKVRRIEYRARQIDVRKGGQQSLPAVEPGGIGGKRQRLLAKGSPVADRQIEIGRAHV